MPPGRHRAERRSECESASRPDRAGTGCAEPEIVKLCEHIREVIHSKRRPDEDALVKAQPEGEALNAAISSIQQSKAKQESPGH